MLVQFFETLKLISLHYSFVPPAFFEGIWQGKATAGALELLQSCLGLWWVWMVMNTVCFLHLSFLLIKTSYLLAVPEAYHGGPPQSWEKHWEAGILLREVRFMTAHRDRVQVKKQSAFFFFLWGLFWLPLTTLPSLISLLPFLSIHEHYEVSGYLLPTDTFTSSWILSPQFVIQHTLPKTLLACDMSHLMKCLTNPGFSEAWSGFQFESTVSTKNRIGQNYSFF